MRSGDDTENVDAWFDDAVDAEHWVTVLSAVSAPRHRNHLRDVTLTLLDSMEKFSRSDVGEWLQDALHKAVDGSVGALGSDEARFAAGA